MQSVLEHWQAPSLLRHLTPTDASYPESPVFDFLAFLFLLMTLFVVCPLKLWTPEVQWLMAHTGKYCAS
jgi:hypothetical protein